MNIVLDYEIKIKVKEGNKAKDNLSIFFREFTREEVKEHKQLQKKFKDIFSKGQKLLKKQTSLEKKAELYELNEQYDKALDARDSYEKLEEDVDALNDELIDIGGEDQIEFAEESAKQRFETLVSGKDKEKLATYAEIKGYANLMRSLDVEKVALEKKQSGQ